MRVRLTEPAEFDLEQLGDRIALIDPERAKLIAKQLKTAAHAIGAAPLRCPAIGRNPRFRKKSIHPFILLFEVKPDHVLILRIAHERSDWTSLV